MAFSLQPGNPVSIPFCSFPPWLPALVLDHLGGRHLGHLAWRQRLERLTQSSGAGGDDVLDVDDGLETTGFKAVVPTAYAKTSRSSSTWGGSESKPTARRPLCAALGPDTCRTTRGFAPLGMRAKWQFLDEWTGAPVSWRSVRPPVRTVDRPHATALPTWAKAPPILAPRWPSAGRAAGDGSGAHASTVAGLFGNQRGGCSPSVPGSEYSIDTEFPAGTWLVESRPTLTYWERPQGIDLEDLLASPRLATDIDRFGALAGPIGARWG